MAHTLSLLLIEVADRPLAEVADALPGSHAARLLRRPGTGWAFAPDVDVLPGDAAEVARDLSRALGARVIGIHVCSSSVEQLALVVASRGELERSLSDSSEGGWDEVQGLTQPWEVYLHEEDATLGAFPSLLFEETLEALDRHLGLGGFLTWEQHPEVERHVRPAAGLLSRIGRRLFSRAGA